MLFQRNLPRRSPAQRDSGRCVGGSGDVRFNFVMNKGKYGPIAPRVKYPVLPYGRVKRQIVAAFLGVCSYFDE